MPTLAGALVRVEDLRVHLPSPGGTVRAIDGVSFELGAGEALGIVGESGSGKSMLARAIMGLLPPRAGRAGTVRFDGTDLNTLHGSRLRKILGRRIALVFQDPTRSLNPVLRIERQLTEGIRVHLGVDAREARRRALSLLAEVGVSDPERRLRSYPHQLSGGMRQRVAIAIALAAEPDLLIADEPTTALDVTVQRKILDLLDHLRRTRGMSLILISHDLAVVSGRTDRVLAMYAGQVVEQGPTTSVFRSPIHPYTRSLLNSIPSLHRPRHSVLTVVEGTVPDPRNPAPGCRFAPRCPMARDACRSQPPPLRSRQESSRQDACILDLVEIEGGIRVGG